MSSSNDKPMMQTVRQRFDEATRPIRDWLSVPENVRRSAFIVLPVLIVLGLLLPPISLLTRLTSIGYTHVRPGGPMAVPSNIAGTQLTLDRVGVVEGARFKLKVHDANKLPRGVDDVPAGHQLLAAPIELDVKGNPPNSAWLSTPIVVRQEDIPYVDPYGWDGNEWRWLSPLFDSSNWVRVRLPLDEFVPEYIVLTKATDSPTEVAVTLLPPPATVPAAVAELPTLEMRAYGLLDSDGRVGGEAFTVPSSSARRFGVIDNVEGTRTRTDLVSNVLIRPESRQRHRQAVVDVVRRDDLDGVVIDYAGVPSDLQGEFIDFVRMLGDDLDGMGVDLVVVVPMPQSTAGGWTSGAYDWRALGAASDGVRVRLPGDAPMAIDRLDDLTKWGLTQVERGKLQLAVPAQGRDIVSGEVSPISFGEALRRVIDLAESDAPARITPGEEVTVELPTMRAAAIERDPDTGVWRFNAWDANRRQHTIWLSDAAGHKPAFDIASRYRLGSVVLDGVSADLDPTLWNMLRTFAADGVAAVALTDYRLRWQLTDERGQVLQETTHPLGGATFSFTAPNEQGSYRLLVNLIAADGRPVALGVPADVRVAPPPPPTPRPTLPVFYVPPTAMTYQTAPAPIDELRITRTPVRVLVDATPTPDRQGTAVAGATMGTPWTPGTPGSVTTATVPPPQARVAVAEAVLRSGPGIGYDVVSDLRAGEKLEVIGRAPGGGWLYVRVVKTGIEGWALTQVLEVNVSIPALGVVVTPTPSAVP